LQLSYFFELSLSVNIIPEKFDEFVPFFFKLQAADVVKIWLMLFLSLANSRCTVSVNNSEASR